MIRKMTLNKVKNFIKDNALFKGAKITTDGTFKTLFYIEEEDTICGGTFDKKFVFSLTSGFLNSFSYIGFYDLEQITKLDKYIRDYERERFNQFMEGKK